MIPELKCVLNLIICISFSFNAGLSNWRPTGHMWFTRVKLWPPVGGVCRHMVQQWEGRHGTALQVHGAVRGGPHGMQLRGVMTYPGVSPGHAASAGTAYEVFSP